MATNGGGDLLRDRELAQWLGQRLESTDAVWAASRNLCSAMSKELLANIPSCFVDLQTHIKLKILLSVLYLPKRNVEQWRDEIEDVLSLACQDTDEWVQTLADLLKEYPTTSGISLNMESDGSQFTKTLQELRKLLRRHLKGRTGQVLPLDAAYMNKQAAHTTWGVQNQQVSGTSRYFSLKRKPKAAAQRIDFLQKSADAATQMKYKNGSFSSNLPIRHKNSVRRMDDDVPLKSPNSNQIHGKQVTPGFRAPPKPVSRQTSMSTTSQPRRVSSTAGSAIKMIDINETPQALEKKRKTMEAEEKAAKKAAKEEQRRQREEERLQKKLQRDAKVQRSLLQESQGQEGAGTAVSESAVTPADGKGEPAVTPVLIQPTPDYAADLFDGAVSAARAATTASVPAPQSATTEPVQQTSIFSPSSMINQTLESQGSLSRVCIPAVPTTINLNGGAGIMTPTTSRFFDPMALSANDSDSPVSAASPATVPELLSSAGSASAVDQATKKASPTKGSPSKAKKRKTEQEEQADNVSSPGKQPSVITVAPSAASTFHQPSSQPLLRQPGPQIVHFQYGGTTAPFTAPGTGQGLGQMAQTVFVSQQGIGQLQRQIFASSPQQIQQQQQQLQSLAPGTIVLLQQQPTVATGISQMAFNAVTSVSGGATQPVQPQTPTPQGVQSQVLAAGTPVIRQAPPISTALPAQVSGSSLRPPGPTSIIQEQSASASDDGDSKKPTFTITKEVMLKAQEMFRTANKLSRPEKALILGFMAGNRENPCPQMGRVLTVRLSENPDVQAQSDGSTKQVMVETYFQMNYDTGEWKQIRKIRPLREGEGPTSQ